MDKVAAIRLQRDIEELLAHRKSLALAGKRTSIVSAYCHIRPLPEGREPLLFLFHAGKRTMARSHDRNRQKRRMREAVRKLPVFDEIEANLTKASQQALVLLRATKPPSSKGSWDDIINDLAIIGSRLDQEVRQNA